MIWTRVKLYSFNRSAFFVFLYHSIASFPTKDQSAAISIAHESTKAGSLYKF